MGIGFTFGHDCSSGIYLANVLACPDIGGIMIHHHQSRNPGGQPAGDAVGEQEIEILLMQDLEEFGPNRHVPVKSRD